MSPQGFRFGVFEVDPDAAELRKHGIRIRLQGQPFQLLVLLLQHPGKIITRDELRHALWSDHTFVDFDRNLNKTINKLRAALGDSAESPRFVETLHRRGYRFIAPVTSAVAFAEDTTSGTVAPWPATEPHAEVESSGQRFQFPLTGEVLPGGGRLRRRAVLVALAAAVVMLFAAVVYLRLRPVTARGGTPTAVAPRRSVAVIGFRNLSGRADQAWISTALADWLTTDLSAGEQLRAIPAESVARMKIELSLPDVDSLNISSLARVGKNLGTDFIVVGSYATVGKAPEAQVRLDLRLQDTRNGETLGAISETGTEARLFDIVSRAGQRLRSTLGVEAVMGREGAEIAAALPTNHDAARLYSEGLASLRVFDALSARDRLQKAIAIEPNYALSHSAMASAWAALGYDDNARAEAKKAFERSSGLPRAERLLVEGRYHEMSKNWDKAIEIYRALFEFFPDSLEYGLALADAQVSAGKGKDALYTVEVLHKLPAPLGDDPRIDLAEDRVAEALGDYKRDQTATIRAAAKARGLGASLLLAQALTDQSWALENLGQLEDAASVAGEAKQLFAGAGDKQGFARALIEVAIALEDEGNPAGAKNMYEEALVMYRQIGNKQAVGNDLDNIGDVLFALGDLAGARRSYEESLATHREIGHEDGVALAKGALGTVLLAMGDREGAEKAYRESLEICERIGDKSKAAIDVAGLGRVLQADGNIEQASKYEAQAVSMFENIGNRLSAAQTQLVLAEILLDQGRSSEAALRARKAAEEFEQEKAAKDESLAEAVLSQSLLMQGRADAARAAIDHATALLEKCRDREVELFVSLTAARVRAASGNSADAFEAAKSLQQLSDQATKIGFVRYELEPQLALGEIEIRSGNSGNGRLHLKAVERAAADRGFRLIAQKAAADLRQISSLSTERE